MVITAKGKNIDTSLFQNLFVQGEVLAEKITFRIQRHYRGYDLKSCSFQIRGTNTQNKFVQQPLFVIYSDATSLELEWNVIAGFTASAGKLNLEINALTIVNGDISYLMKFILTPIYVRESLTGDNVPVLDVKEQAINEINKTVIEGVDTINSAIESFDISAVEKRIDSIEDTVNQMSDTLTIKALSLEEYNSSEHSENVLYVII